MGGQAVLTAGLLVWRKLIRYFSKETESFTEHFQQAINQFSLYNIYREKLAKMYNRVGNIHRHKNDWGQAIFFHEKTLEHFRALGDPTKTALAYTNLAIDYNNFGRMDKALFYHKKSYDLLKGMGDKVGLAVVLSNIGKIYEHKKDFERAISYYKKSLKLSQRQRYHTGIEKGYRDLSAAYKKQKDMVNADKYLKKLSVIAGNYF